MTMWKIFAMIYLTGNGHTNEDDTNTIILRMKIIDGIIMSEGVKYEF